MRTFVAAACFLCSPAFAQATWSRLYPPASPPLTVPMIAGHGATGTVVLLSAPFYTYTLQHWQLQGDTWTQLAVGVPTYRDSARMTYDSARQRLVLFGGVSASGVDQQDTWEWTGTTWTIKSSATQPTARSRQAMAYDPVRGRTVVFGGWRSSPSTRLQDTWEWDGTEWIPHGLVGPAPRWRLGLAYDVGLGRVIAYGGWVGLPGANYPVNDTWEYRTASPASVVAFGAGCAGSAGTPQLDVAPYHLPWLGDTVRTRVANLAPGALGALFCSSLATIAPIDLTAVGMPGCSLLVPLDVLEFEIASADTAEWSAFVPTTTALAGLGFGQQAFPLDAAANPFGLTASNGIEATIGIR